MALSFEIQTLRDNKWLINHYLGEREEAIQTAKSLFAEDPKLQSVMVIAEHYNPQINETQEVIIYREDRGKDRSSISKMLKERKPVSPTSAKNRAKHKKVARPPQKSSDNQIDYVNFISYLILAVLVVVVLYKYAETKGMLDAFDHQFKSMIN